jgi:hypothetical protein
VSAEFFESARGKPFVYVSHRIGSRDLTRTIRLKLSNVDALRERVGGSHGNIRVSSDLVKLVTTTDVDTVSTRRKAEITIHGQKLKGRILPVLEEGSLYLLMHGGATQKIDPSQIERLTIKRSVLDQVAGKTLERGVEGVLTGGVAGLFAGLTLESKSVAREMKFGAAIGGIVGAGIGILDGIFSAERTRTYQFHPIIQPESLELQLTMGFLITEFTSQRLDVVGSCSTASAKNPDARQCRISHPPGEIFL